LAWADLRITEGRLGLCMPEADAAGRDLAGRIVLPGLVDCHTHIDKGQVWARSPNPDGSFASALAAAPTDHAHVTADDVATRATFMLDCAEAHGTVALRSHIDTDGSCFDLTWEVLCDLADRRAERLTLQLAPFTGVGDTASHLHTIAAKAADRPGAVLSAFVSDTAGADEFLDQMIAAADRHGLGIDVHVDETVDPGAHALRRVAKAVLRTGFEGPILAGHACALAVQSAAERDRTLDLVAAAGIGVVALPACNAYLMDRRAGASPRLRGHAPLHELRARGIPVALASDNARDAFHAYGDLDMAELFRDALRFCQIDHPVGDWPAVIGPVPAQLMGLDGPGWLRDGGPADLIVTEARCWSEFGARPVQRQVIRRGQPLDLTPPPYSTLDMLKGLAP